MGTMLYNGVELPDIETVWTDKTTYPYALLSTSETGNQLLFCYYGNGSIDKSSGDVYLTKPHGYLWYEYDIETAAWVYLQGYKYNFSSFYETGTVFWTSMDLYYTSSTTIALTASDPVDPNAPAATPFSDLLAVFMLGQRLRPGLMGKGGDAK